MIIRENEQAFLFIRQHHHAIIAEQIITKLSAYFFPEHSLKSSVRYAIRMHDCGWIPFDQAPFWNAEKNAPYSFIDYPTPIKTVLYKYGIDEVEQHDLYAGLLCSKHYSLFLANDSSAASRTFVANEKRRQVALQHKIGVDDALLAFHFDLLKFADDFSLFLCLNEPGARREDIHYFFKNGIQLPKEFEEKLGNKLELHCLDKTTIACENSPFREPFTLSIPQTEVSKENISKDGLSKSYNEGEEDILTVEIIKK